MPKTQEEYRVDVCLGYRSYPIHIHTGSLDKTGEYAAKAVAGKPVAVKRKCAIITSPKIASHYAERVISSLNEAGFDCLPTIAIPAGERFKNLATVERIYSHLYEGKVDRKDVIIALGGGVVGDIAGFVASSYLRGLDLVQIPTTLLSQVDSSVGGKVGVNYRKAKNSIGAFYQPRAVIIDPETLKTLPARERLSGLAEVIKYGAIDSVEMFVKIQAEARNLFNLTSSELGYAIAKSCEIKARIVEADEHETSGLRANLNFGHTIGHALEAETNYKRYSHGEAIAIGMLSACLVGEEVGFTKPETTHELATALEFAGFKLRLEEERNIDDILALLSLDKKTVSGQARFVLIDRIGHALSGHAVSLDVVRTALERQRSWAGGNSPR